MQEQIINYVRQRKDVSFAELCRDIPGFKGELTLTASQCENVILWAGMSAEAISTMAELEREEKIHFKSTPVLTYMIDGATLKLPVAKALKNYKSPRWLPVIVTTNSPPKRKSA